MAAPGMGMLMEATEKRMEERSVPKMPMTAQQAAQDKMQKLENAWDKLSGEWAAQGLGPPPKMATQVDKGTILTDQEKVWQRQRAEWEAVQAKIEAEWAAGQGDQEVTYSNQWSTEKSGTKKSAKSGTKKASSMSDEMATNSSIDIRPITIAVNNLNTTINKVLTAIESRLKKNDVNSQLKKMTEFISQINDSLPAATEGGGTRRLRMKGKKMSRKNKIY
jgi:hypothetical protein